MRRPALFPSVFVALVALSASAVPARPLAAQAEADSAESVAVALSPAAALRAVVGALARAGFVVADASPAGTVVGERYSGVATVRVYGAVVPAAPGDTASSRAYFRMVSYIAGSPAPRMAGRGGRGDSDAWVRLDAAKRELAAVHR